LRACSTISADAGVRRCGRSDRPVPCLGGGGDAVAGVERGRGGVGAGADASIGAGIRLVAGGAGSRIDDGGICDRPVRASGGDGRRVGRGARTRRSGRDCVCRRARRTRATRIPTIAETNATRKTRADTLARLPDDDATGRTAPKITRSNITAATRDGPLRRPERNTLRTTATMKKRTISGKSSKGGSSVGAHLTVPGIVRW
jgi:hypothetical protein